MLTRRSSPACGWNSFRWLPRIVASVVKVAPTEAYTAAGRSQMKHVLSALRSLVENWVPQVAHTRRSSVDVES